MSCFNSNNSGSNLDKSLVSKILDSSKIGRDSSGFELSSNRNKGDNTSSIRSDSKVIGTVGDRNLSSSGQEGDQESNVSSFVISNDSK